VRKVLNEGSYVQYSPRFFPHDETIPEEGKINKNQIILLIKRDKRISIKIIFFLLLKNLLFINHRLILRDNPFQERRYKKSRKKNLKKIKIYRK